MARQVQGDRNGLAACTRYTHPREEDSQVAAAIDQGNSPAHNLAPLVLDEAVACKEPAVAFDHSHRNRLRRGLQPGSVVFVAARPSYFSLELGTVYRCSSAAPNRGAGKAEQQHRQRCLCIRFSGRDAEIYCV